MAKEEAAAARHLRLLEGKARWHVLRDCEVRSSPRRRSRVVGRKKAGDVLLGSAVRDDDHWIKLSPTELYAMRSTAREAFVCARCAGCGRPELGTLVEPVEGGARAWSFEASLARVVSVGLDWPEEAPSHGDFRPAPRPEWLATWNPKTTTLRPPKATTTLRASDDDDERRRRVSAVGVVAERAPGATETDVSAFARRLLGEEVGAAAVFVVSLSSSFGNDEGGVFATVSSSEEATKKARTLGLGWLVRGIDTRQTLHVPGSRTLSDVVLQGDDDAELGLYECRSCGTRGGAKKNLFKLHAAFLADGYRELVVLPLYSRVASKDHTTWHLLGKNLEDDAYFPGSADPPKVFLVRLPLADDDDDRETKTRRRLPLADADSPVVLSLADDDDDDDFCALAHCAQHGLLFKVDGAFAGVAPRTEARRRPPPRDDDVPRKNGPLPLDWPPGRRHLQWDDEDDGKDKDDDGAATDTVLKMSPSRFGRRHRDRHRIARRRASCAAASADDTVAAVSKKASVVESVADELRTDCKAEEETTSAVSLPSSQSED